MKDCLLLDEPGRGPATGGQRHAQRGVDECIGRLSGTSVVEPGEFAPPNLFEQAPRFGHLANESGWTQSFPRTWMTPRYANASIPRRSMHLLRSRRMQSEQHTRDRSRRVGLPSTAPSGRLDRYANLGSASPFRHS